MKPRTQPPKRNPFYVLPSDAINYYFDKAYEYVVNVTLRDQPGIKPTRQQTDALKAIIVYDKVGIRSGHGLGKTTLEAWLVEWFLSTRPGPRCRVPCTAPTGKQLTNILWPEINAWLSKSLIREELQWMKESVFHKAEPEGRFATWRTSDRSDNMQGFHGDHVLWIIDEAYGIVDQTVFDVIEGSITHGDNKIIFAGNPTVVNGFAADAFTKNKAEWSPPFGQLFTWSCEDSEIVDQERVKREAEKWGRNSDFFRIRRLGLPPLGNPDAFLQMSDLERCVSRETAEDGEIELGVDTARFGDDLTSIAARKGYYIYDPITMSRKDDVEIYNAVLNVVRSMRERHQYQDRIRVKIFITGNWGAGVYDMLKHNTTDNIEAVALIETAKGGNDMYYNPISVMFGEFREGIDKWRLPNDPDLLGELSTRKYKIVDGKTCMEPKSSFKDIVGHSPDRSDSVMACITKRAIVKKMFTFWPTEFLSPIDVKWEKITKNTVCLVSLWKEKNQKTSALICLWQSLKGTLFVLAEHEFDNPQPETVIGLLTKIIKYISNEKVKNLIKFQWFGNDEFFDKNTGDLQSLYRRRGIYVRENLRYNEAGAVAFVAGLTAWRNPLDPDDRKLVIDENLDGLPYQLQEWPAEAGKEGYGLARALCGIVSALHETGQVKPVVAPVRPYSDKSLEFQDRVHKLAEEDRLDEVNRPKDDVGAYKKDSWML